MGHKGTTSLEIVEVVWRNVYNLQKIYYDNRQTSVHTLLVGK